MEFLTDEINGYADIGDKDIFTEESDGEASEHAGNAKTAKVGMADIEKDLKSNVIDKGTYGSMFMTLKMLAQIVSLAFGNKEAGKLIGKSADMLSKDKKDIKEESLVEASDYDQSIMDGNRVKINSALQYLEHAYGNVKGMEDNGLEKHLKKAIDSIVKYNKESLKR